MEFFTISMLNGLSYGLLLFMLSSGLTLIFSMMGVLNFAHASFYMVGAYVAYTDRPAGGLLARAGHRAAGGRRARRAVRALLPAPRAQVRPRARTADHLRPVLRDARAGAADLGPHRGRVPAARDAARARRSRSINSSVDGLQMVCGRGAGGDVPGRRRGGARGLLAVPGDARLHDAGRAGDAGGAVADAHAHAHRPGHPERADAPRDGRGAGPQRAARVHAGLRRRRGAGRPGGRDRRQHLRHRAGDGRDAWAR